MSFELLANEILLHLFEFLSTTDLIHAFHGLNARFNSLLLENFTIYGIDFRSMYSDDFIAICQVYLPALINKVPSLYLPEKNGPSQRLNELDAHGFELGQFVQLTKLSLSYLSYKQLMNKIAVALPHLINLTHLTLDHCSLTENEMISNLARDESTEEYIDELLSTFRTSFWLEERDWFVQCDWNPNDSRVIFYTLPYAFEYFSISDQTVGKLTCFQEKNQQSYDAVRHLGFYVEPAKCSQIFDIQFYKVKSLEIRFPVSDYFWSIVPTFDHMTTCTIIPGPSTEECKNQLQLLLSRASSLSFLGFSKNHKAGSIESLPLKTNNTMIKCFSLQGSYGSYDEKQCMSFSHSSLAVQCEELHISVKNRISICYLVKTMRKLRLLYVKCEDEKRKEYSTEDNLIDWLRNQVIDIPPLIEISRWNSIILLRTS